MAYAYLGPVAKESGNGNLPVTRIVVHCTAGADAGDARDIASYFRSSAARGSAHAVVDPSELVICAFDTVVCWHAPPNSHSLGLEICCSLGGEGKNHWGLDSHQKMLRLSARWVAEKCIKHSIPVRKLTVAQVAAGSKGICGHVDVSNAFGQSDHWDPGPYFPWTQFIATVADEYKKLTTPAPPPSGDVIEMATVAELADAFELGLGNYLRRFFADEQGTGDAIWDETRANALNLLTAVRGATDEAVVAKLDALGGKLDGQTDAINRLAAAIEAQRPLA